MSVSNFDELIAHAGHKIVCVTYGRDRKPPWHNVAIECEDCGEVLLDYDRNFDVSAQDTANVKNRMGDWDPFQ